MTAEPLEADAAPDELLAAIEAATAQLAAANALAAAVLSWRDRLVLDAARSGRTLTAIAAAADVTPQMVGTLTRAAGIRRYRPRGAAPQDDAGPPEPASTARTPGPGPRRP